jgi:hypothetical protein
MKKAVIMFSILVLGAVAAYAGTISIPVYVDFGGDSDGNLIPPNGSATWIALKNNTASAQEYTVLYHTLAGVDVSPVSAAARTFSVGANASIGWRPVSSTDPNEVAGASVPNATSSATGSATILYVDATDPSGRVFGINASGYAYSFAMFPAQ